MEFRRVLFRSFRSGYAYDNILYVVAGELVAAVSGQSWESFIRDRVFRAAGMADSVSDETERFANPNRAHPHARIDGPVRGLGTQVEIGRAHVRTHVTNAHLVYGLLIKKT